MSVHVYVCEKERCRSESWGRRREPAKEREERERERWKQNMNFRYACRGQKTTWRQLGRVCSFTWSPGLKFKSLLLSNRHLYSWAISPSLCFLFSGWIILLAIHSTIIIIQKHLQNMVSSLVFCCKQRVKNNACVLHNVGVLVQVPVTWLQSKPCF